MKPVKGSTPRLEMRVAGSRLGRKRLFSEPMSSVTTRLPTTVHDGLCQVAAAQEKSVAEVVRNILIVNLVVVQATKR